jgi:hypothetical protein
MKALLLLSMMTFAHHSLATRNELPFQEPVRLVKINLNKPLPINLLSNFKGINIEGKKNSDRKIALRH